MRASSSNSSTLIGNSDRYTSLAALLSCFDWKSLAPELPRQLVKGVLSVSGVHDLTPLVHVPFLQADLRLDDDSARRLVIAASTKEPPRGWG